MSRIAVMGGTFDPIHYGHLVAAEAVLYEFDAQRVIFIPAGIPPHKKNSRVSGQEDRYRMTELAVESNPHFVASRMEIDREGETYTIDTVRELGVKYPGAEILFITGADAAHQILTWRDAGELLKLCDFVAVTRPGYDKRELQREVERLQSRFASRLHFLEVPALAISSSDIRRRVSAGKPITYLLPEAVKGYIAEKGLYRVGDGEYIKRAVREKLSDYRYTHTLGVLEQALRLAGIYSAAEDKVIIAALLHDYAKELPDKLTLCHELGVKADAIMKKQPELTHSFLSAELARREFGVNDPDILNAIAYHTTGRPGMSTLEKIIFLADLTEQNRKPYPGMDSLRALAERDMDKAVTEGLKRKLDYKKKDKDESAHPLGVEALKYYSRGEKKKISKEISKEKKEATHDGSGQDGV